MEGFKEGTKIPHFGLFHLPKLLVGDSTGFRIGFDFQLFYEGNNFGKRAFFLKV